MSENNKYTLVVASSKDEEQWNDFVFSSEMSTIYHTINWLKIAVKNTNTKLYTLMLYKGEELVAIFPHFIKRVSFLKYAFSPINKCEIPYLGPVIMEYNSLKTEKKEDIILNITNLVDDFLFKKLRVSYSSTVLPPHMLDIRHWIWRGYSTTPLFNYFIDLDSSIESLWEQLKSTRRREIKHCISGGIEVTISNTVDSLNYIYKSQVERYAEQGKKYPFNLKYLVEIFKDPLLSRYVNIFISYFDGNPVGGMIVLKHPNNICSMWIGATKNKIRNMSPTILLYWKVIEWAKNNNFRYCEIIGADIPGLYRFKAGFNPELRVNFLCKKYNLFGYTSEKVYTFLRYLRRE